MNYERYIEVYDNNTDELIGEYKINLPDNIVIRIISPDDDDDELAIFPYILNEKQVIDLVGDNILNKYKGKDIEYHIACYQS